jgi:histidinol-phosphate phosphatase family protein
MIPTSPPGAAEPRAAAILLATDPGTRLQHPTDEVPPGLVEVAGRPLLEHWIDRLAEAGIREARVVTHALADRVREFLAEVNARGAIALRESHEPTPLGTAGTVAANVDLADGVDAILLVRAQSFADVDLGRMLAFHRSHGDPVTVLLHREAGPGARGLVELDTRKRVVAFDPGAEVPAGGLADAGVYVASADAFRRIAEAGTFDLPGPVGAMRGWPWAWYHRNVHTIEDLERVRADAPAILADRRDGRPAVFLDRDGTIIDHVHYLSDPAEVRLLPGAAEALRKLRAGGFARVVVTNQSAVGRGIITEDRLHEIHEEMHRQLEAEGAAVDAVYFSPDVPSLSGGEGPEGSLRKPGPRDVDRRGGRPGPRSILVVDGRRHGRGPPGRGQRRVPGQHPRADRQGADPGRGGGERPAPRGRRSGGGRLDHPRRRRHDRSGTRRPAVPLVRWSIPMKFTNARPPVMEAMAKRRRSWRPTSPWTGTCPGRSARGSSTTGTGATPAGSRCSGRPGSGSGTG